MNDTVEQHYERLLAKHYSWMFGQPLATKVAEQRALLAALGVGPLAGLAVDLGCGSGFQTLALAELGASRVLAVDTSQMLLDELTAHAGSQPIEPVLADIRRLGALVEPGSAEIIACMGDTLPHLADRDEVRQLFADAHAALAPGGALVLGYRDLSQALEGLDRILPVRADDERIMICILDFHPDTVTVTDVIHHRDPDGWRMEKSSYAKLRLAPEWVAEALAGTGFRIARDEAMGGMQAAVAVKPDAG